MEGNVLTNSKDSFHSQLEELGSCSVCPLNNTSIKVKDKGSKKSGVVVVGEAPHTEEVKVGIPFVGESGKLLNNLLSLIRLNRDDIVVANAIKCKLPDKKRVGKLLKDAMHCCRPFLVRTILKSSPKIIVTLGESALFQVLGKKGIMSHRGKFYFSKEFNCYVLPTIHPAYVLRAGERNILNLKTDNLSYRESIIFKDFSNLRRWLDGELNDQSESLLDYKEVTNLSDLMAFIGVGDLPFAFDLEWNPVTGEPICVSLSNAEGFARVYFFDNRDLSLLRKLKVLFSSGITKIVANRPVDENKLKFLNIGIGGKIHDIFLLAHLVDENIPISLESLSTAYTQFDHIKEDLKFLRKVFENKEAIKEHKEEIIKYSCRDADTTFRLWNVLSKKIREDSKVLRYYGRFLKPAQDMLSEISLNGCRVDIKKLKENEKILLAEYDKLHEELLKEMPEKIKRKYKDNLTLTRNGIVSEFLFTKGGLNLKPVYLTDITNQPSITEKHLNLFRKNSWVKDFLKWKKLHKIITTYIQPLYDFIQPDGKVYPQTLLYRTVTGRTTIINPPIQQIPQRNEYANYVRELFVADDGWIMGTRDLSQSEVRVMAWLSNETEMLNALMNDIDIHTLTASKILNKPLEEVTKEDRQKAKSFVFGFLYGMQANSFVDYAYEQYGLEFTLEEATEFRDLFFKTYPNILCYHNKIINEVAKKGYIYSPLGRKRRLPNALDKNSLDAYSAYRQAINFGVQSFSSDYGLLAMKLFNDRIKKDAKLKGKVKLLWFIHDAVFFLAKEDVFDLASECLYKDMRTMAKIYIKEHFNITVPYPVKSELKYGKNWGMF